MTTVADLARWLDAFAPPDLAEEWDNVGLLWGDPSGAVTKVMMCLTVTPHCAGEAILQRAELIVSHHPVLFRAVKRVRADHPETGVLWRLARAGVSILSPHTSFDNTPGGINDGLAQRLGLVEVSALRASRPLEQCKVVVFTPEADHERVLAAAFAAGAGRIGAYDECSFSIPGEGTFFGTEGANPAVGQAGRRERVAELRVEVVCPSSRVAQVLAAIRAHHSYEEPAIDVYPLQSEAKGPGIGRVGRLSVPVSLAELAERAASSLGARGTQAVGDPLRKVERVAVACGAGDDFVTDAARVADVLLTGEARFHRLLEADARGLGVIVAGHYATERPGIEDLAARIGAAFPALEVWPSRQELDPSWLPEAP